MLVRLAVVWTDPFGVSHCAGDMVDIDAVTLAELEEQGVVENMTDPKEAYVGPTGNEPDGYVGPTGAEPDGYVGPTGTEPDGYVGPTGNEPDGYVGPTEEDPT
jgi:hypothetical protein